MVGFLSFIPTNYIGLSELGIISFIGLIVGLFSNLLLLPSLLIIFLKKLNLKIILKKSLLEKIIFFLLIKKL